MLNYSTSIEQFTEQLSLEALGIDLHKKTVAIVTACNEMSVSNAGLGKIAEKVKEGVISRDFNAVTFNLPSLGADITLGEETNKFELPMRDSIADIVEMYANLNAIDGFVFVANDTFSVAGMLMGSLRANVPSLFIGGGIMKTAEINGKKIGFYSAYESAGLLKSGRITLTDLEKIQKNLIQGNGNAGDSYMANSSLIIAEALGLALPKTSTVPSYTDEIAELAFNTGTTIAHMVKNVMTPRSIASEQALKTAVCVDLAMGSSSTSIVNLLAIAHETGNDLNYETINQLKAEVPQIVDISTNKQCFIEDLHNAGGVYAVIRKLIERGTVDGIYKIFDGTPMRTHIEETAVIQNSIVIDDINKTEPNPLNFLYGNLAENGAISFLNEVPYFKGTAKVFESEESALDAISSRLIKKGDVVVIRNEGPESGPGMRHVYLPISMLVGLDLDKDVAVITDGRIPNISRGIVVGNIAKETADNLGLLDVIQNGDTIEISFEKQSIAVRLSSKEIAQRKKYVVPQHKEVGAFLQKYAKSVAPSNLGCFTNYVKERNIEEIYGD